MPRRSHRARALSARRLRSTHPFPTEISRGLDGRPYGVGVRLLLDTHALIWALEGSARLSKTARRLIEDTSNEVFVSVVSAWEIAMKKSLGRLRVPDDLSDATDEAGFIRRPLGFAEARRLESLPPHHSDPFDRMLVAHALEEGATLVTRDRYIGRYPVPIVW